MSTMNSAEGINFKVELPGEKRKPCKLQYLTLDQLLQWINSQSGIDEAVKEELAKKAKGYPNFALSSFKKNFSTHLSKAQKIVRDKTPLYTKELGDDDEPESNSPATLFDGTGSSQEIPKSPDENPFG